MQRLPRLFRCQCCTDFTDNNFSSDNETYWFSKLSNVFSNIRWKSCVKKCTKLLLIIVNFFFLGLGMLMLVAGAYTYLEVGAYGRYMAGVPVLGTVVDFEKIPALLLVLGGAVSLLSFLGCCGACSDSVCFLSLYAILLFVALVLQVCLSISVIVYQNTLLINLESSLQHQLTYEYNSSAVSHNETNKRIAMVTRAWDVLQIKFQCCGAKGPHDFQASMWRNRSTSFIVPLSCCVITFPQQLDQIEVNKKKKNNEKFSFLHGSSYLSGSQQSQEIDYLPLLVNEDQCQIQAALNLGSPPLKHESEESNFENDGMGGNFYNKPYYDYYHHSYKRGRHQTEINNAVYSKSKHSYPNNKYNLKTFDTKSLDKRTAPMVFKAVDTRSMVHAGMVDTYKRSFSKHLNGWPQNRIDSNARGFSFNNFPHQHPTSISWAVHLKGCQTAILDWLRPKISLLVVLTVSTAIFQVLHFFIACSLLSSLKKTHTDPLWFEEDSR